MCETIISTSAVIANESIYYAVDELVATGCYYNFAHQLDSKISSTTVEYQIALHLVESTYTVTY